MDYKVNLQKTGSNYGILEKLIVVFFIKKNVLKIDPMPFFPLKPFILKPCNRQLINFIDIH